ncbi:MAG: restriction endonuclease [Bacteroidales bacterium]|nr:restriction endonuclease [Bacteroidales bacterium]
MAIWAFNTPNKESLKFVSDSLKQGISRFGWGYIDTADIRVLGPKPWGEMTKDELLIWSKTSFLSKIKKWDWIVHINVPHWGTVTTGQVIEKYDFEIEDNEISDFRHFFKLDLKSILKFNRNSPNVHPLVSRKLKLRGKYWRVYAEKEFFETIENLKNGNVSIQENSTIGVHYLKNELKPFYDKITKIIHNTHPEKKLEYFLADVFENIPNVTEVKVNGSGWGTDYGADIIVKYNSGLEILDLNKEDTLVVQVKSYEGQHWSTNAVAQIKTAIETFNADAGMIITTAKSTENIEKEIENVSSELEIPISLIAGENVAKFVLKYGKDLLIDI